MITVQLYTKSNELSTYTLNYSDTLENAYRKEYTSFLKKECVQTALIKGDLVICTLSDDATGSLLTRIIDQCI